MLGISSPVHLMWCFAIGALIACVYAFYVKYVTGRLINALIEQSAFSEASAKTLAELGLQAFPYKFALRKSSYLSKAVISSDTERNRFFVPEKNAEKLLIKYKSDRSTVFALLVTLFLIIFVAVILSWVLPPIIDYFKGVA